MNEITFKDYQDITPTEELDTEGSLHCKACDVRFYPDWIPEHQAFEELCQHCLNEAGL